MEKNWKRFTSQSRCLSQWNFASQERVPNNAGTYTCVAKNALRSVEANSVVKVLKILNSCSSIKSGRSGSSSGSYIIDPDGKGGVAPFSVYCDMSDKGGVGVTVINHESESRTHVNSVNPPCTSPGGYSKDLHRS